MDKLINIKTTLENEKVINSINNLYLSIREYNNEKIYEDFDIFIEELKQFFEDLCQKDKTKDRNIYVQTIIEIRRARTDWDKYEEINILDDYFKNAFGPWLERHIKN